MTQLVKWSLCVSTLLCRNYVRKWLISLSQTLLMRPDILRWKSRSQNAGSSHIHILQPPKLFQDQKPHHLDWRTYINHAFPRKKLFKESIAHNVHFLKLWSFRFVNCLKAGLIQFIVGHDCCNFDKNWNRFKLTIVIVHLFATKDFL